MTAIIAPAYLTYSRGVMFRYTEVFVMNKNNKAKDLFAEAMGDFVDTHFEKSVSTLSKALEYDPEFKLALVARGSAYFQLNQFDEALEDFNRALAFDPNYARAYHLRGLVKEKMGLYEDAIQDFDEAIKLNPEYGAAYFSRASLKNGLSHTEEAMADIEMVTHLTNKNLETFMNTSNIWQTQQMRVEAAMETELNR